MRLRTQLLLLIAVLVAAVLLLSLAIIYRDVRRQVLEQQSKALTVALTTFRSQENERFQRLSLLARVLEAEPGFRTILRRTDFATLQDHVANVVMPEYGLDLLVLADGQGSLTFESDRPEPPRGPLELRSALQTEPTTGYWLRQGKLFQVASTPLYDAGDVIVGTAILGLAVDQPLVDRLAHDTNSFVQLEAGGKVLATTFPGSSKDEFDQRQAALGTVARLEVAQSTREHLAFLEATRGQLYLLGLGAVGVALLLSFPLLGRLTNPVERMQQAQAELKAVVEGNLDGLLALDPTGRARLANPAAAVALGRPVEELVGQDLRELFPVTDRLVERSVIEREGHAWEVTRTRVRAGAGEVGTLVVLRDATRESHLEERLGELFERLSRLLDPKLLAARNLAALALLERSEVVLRKGRFVFSAWPEAVLEDPPPVEADPTWLRLVLDNLLANAMEPVALRVWRDGGAARVEVTSGGPPVPPELHRAVLSGPLPRPAVPGRPSGLGLGLTVAQELLALHEAHLELEGTTVWFRLPAC